MKRIDKSLILFHDPVFGLEDAHTVLSGQGLTVNRQDDLLVVQWQDGPLLKISLVRGSNIQSEIAKIAKGTDYISDLSGFDAYFAITFDDLNEVLEEINTLIEVQITLQDATQGFLYNTWNKLLSAPESE